MTDVIHIIANYHERAMGIWGKAWGGLTPEQEKAYSKANTIFCGVVIRVLTEIV
jgi:hypothetical protein